MDPYDWFCGPGSHMHILFLVFFYLVHEFTSLECVRFWCFARSDALEKALLHPSCSHTYGFSPVCERRWVFRFSRREYALLQPSNWYAQTETLMLHCCQEGWNTDMTDCQRVYSQCTCEVSLPCVCACGPLACTGP